MIGRKQKDGRLAEALDYIDIRYIGEMMKYYEDVTVSEPAKPEPRRAPRLLKLAVAAAACLLLFGAAIPILAYVIKINPFLHGFAGGGEDTTDSGVGVYYLISWDELNAINALWKGDVFASSPEEVGYLEGDRFIYGRYGGTVVLGWRDQDGAFDSYETYSVAGCVFDISDGGIRVYRDGVLCRLPEAYESNMLSHADVKEIWRNYHISINNCDENFEDAYVYGDYLKPNVDIEPLTKADVEKINALWAKMYPELEGVLIDTDRINRGYNYRYLGTCLGNVIIWISGSGEAETKIHNEYQFSHSSSFEILICNEREIRFLDSENARYVYHMGYEELYKRNEKYEKYFAEHKDEIIEADAIDIPQPHYPQFTDGLEQLSNSDVLDIRFAYADEARSVFYERWGDRYGLAYGDELGREKYLADAEKVWNAAWAEISLKDVYKNRYYGIFDGYAVIAVAGDTDETAEYTWGDSVIILGNGIKLHLCDLNHNASLEVFHPKKFSEETFKAIVERHRAYEEYLESLGEN